MKERMEGERLHSRLLQGGALNVRDLSLGSIVY